MQPLSEVVAIKRRRPGYRVYWIDHAARRPYQADTPLVVLAAGTFGTLRLLFAARERSLRLPPTLGSRFSVGGDVMTIIDGSPDITESPYGPCPGAALLVARNGVHRFAIVEGGAPTDALPLPTAARRSLRSSAGGFAMGRDAPTGTITFDGHELRTTTGRSMDPQLFAEIEATSAEIASGYRARRVQVNVPGGASGR